MFVSKCDHCVIMAKLVQRSIEHKMGEKFQAKRQKQGWMRNLGTFEAPVAHFHSMQFSSLGPIR